MTSLKLYSRMINYVRPYLFLIISSVLLSVFIVISESLSLWFSGSLIKTLFLPEKINLVRPEFSIATINEWLKYKTYLIVQGSNVFDSLKIVCLMVFFLFFAKNLFSYIKNLVVAKLNLNIMRDMRNDVYGNALMLPVSYYDRNRSGHIISLILNDIAAVNYSMVGTFDKLFVEPLRIVFFVGTLFIISTKMTLAVLIILPLMAALIQVIGKTVRRRSKRLFEQMEGLTSVLHETVNCIRTVKMFNMSRTETEKFRKENNKLIRINFRTTASIALSSPLTEALGVLVTVILLWVTGKEVLTGRGFGPEDFVRFLAFLFMTFQPIKSLGNVNNTLQNGLAAAQRTFDLIDIKPEPIVELVTEKVPSFEREIQFSQVHFAYPGTKEEVIRGVSFTVKKGQIAAIVGSSGSGKSTILDLVPRFYEVGSGAILIDNEDVRSCDLVGLRHLFGIVAQETVLFNDTVFYNIAYGKQDASESKVIEAAQAANAWEFIERMPEGLHTIIGERGVMLSGGQRQRLSIARAILKNPSILILDEATSSLDTESERLVQSAINALMKNRTVLVVAHRLSTVSHADIILVIEDGRITEQGTHAELIKREGRYKYFFDMQFSSGVNGS